MSDDQLIIFDTTLRDGEQSPGIALTPSEKLLIAQQLEKLKVDVNMKEDSDSSSDGSLMDEPDSA